MKTILCLCLLAATTSGNVIDINALVDNYLEQLNNQLVKNKTYSYEFPGYKWEGGSHTGGTLVAIDSTYRTGNCTSDIDGNVTKVELHMGLRILTTIVPQLTVGYDTMTAVTKYGINSLVMKYTLIKSLEECSAVSDQLEIEEIDQIINYASLPDYDNKDISDYYRKNVLPVINQALDAYRPELSKQLTDVLCHQQLGFEQISLLSYFQ